MLLIIACVFLFVAILAGFHGGFAGSIALPDRMYGFGQPDNAAVGDKAALVFDISEVSGGTTADGVAVTDQMAVTSFVRKPTSAARNFFAGIGEQAMSAARYGRYHAGGPLTVAIHNPIAANLSVAVGDLLVMVPGQEYLEPLIQADNDGGTTSQTVCNRAASPVGFVRKAVTLTTGQTTTCEAFIWPPHPPMPFSWSVSFAAAPATTSITAFPAFVTRGPGMITAVGYGVATGGNAGDMDLDVLIAGTTIFTTIPNIEDDCTDPFHTLLNVDAPGAGAGPGAAGNYGVINPAANFFTARQLVTYTLVNNSSFVGTGIVINIEGYYF